MRKHRKSKKPSRQPSKHVWSFVYAKFVGKFSGGWAAVTEQARKFLDENKLTNPQASIAAQKAAINKQEKYVRINLKMVPSQLTMDEVIKKKTTRRLGRRLIRRSKRSFRAEQSVYHRNGTNIYERLRKRRIRKVIKLRNCGVGRTR